MKAVVFSASRSFGQFLESRLPQPFEYCPSLRPPKAEGGEFYLLHLTGMRDRGLDWLSQYVFDKPVPVGVCSDVPQVEEMLECVRLGARAYCNSYMAAEHYQQLVRLVSAGDSWFPPQLLQQTFRLAQQAIKPAVRTDLLQALTPRETEIAMAVCEGNSNRRIAEILSISEATVKTHLTNIFRKLEVEDRMALVLALKNS